ncbi:MAG: hypothetical protein L0Y66_16030 [Myxococcaceae bacterium]|nr:hypothetical protein [Myxococcaceae bacterium]MCI0669918.1 hypothetical protein [Myxococcaceae bacterium]
MADLPIQVNVPVVTEYGLGAYVLTEQPDQTSYLGTKPGSTVDRQTVINARLMVQAAF